jgi:hypothetical protein
MTMNTISKLTSRASLFITALALLSPALHAQVQEQKVKVNVPFAFESGKHQYAAGLYTIDRQDPYVVLITCASESGLALARVENGKVAESSKAIFRKNGNGYYLDEIVIAGDSRSIHFLHPKAKRMESIAGNKVADTGVEIALLSTR